MKQYRWCPSIRHDRNLGILLHTSTERTATTRFCSSPQQKCRPDLRGTSCNPTFWRAATEPPRLSFLFRRSKTGVSLSLRFLGSTILTNQQEARKHNNKTRAGEERRDKYELGKSVTAMSRASRERRLRLCFDVLANRGFVCVCVCLCYRWRRKFQARHDVQTTC